MTDLIQALDQHLWFLMGSLWIADYILTRGYN